MEGWRERSEGKILVARQSVRMGDLQSDAMQGTLTFFILSTLNQEPLPGSTIEHRMQRVFSLLEIAARRKGRSGPGSLESALDRLERAGWLQVSRALSESGPETVYSLTPTGREQLEAEREHRTANLAGIIEAGALDDSFRQFLNRNH